MYTPPKVKSLFVLIFPPLPTFTSLYPPFPLATIIPFSVTIHIV